jgi:fluoroacetyl-CoA thioesterase
MYYTAAPLCQRAIRADRRYGQAFWYLFRMAKPVPLGTRAEVERRVEPINTLQRHHPELPPVLSTPEMIGLMEWACFVAQQPYCEADEITVGARICVDHLAATGLGMLVKAEAVMEKMDGKFYIFRVRAWDEQHEIGRGTVHRAVINVARFLKRVEAKQNK